MRYKKKKPWTTRQILIISLCACFVIGIILGSFFGNRLGQDELGEITGYLNTFFNEIKSGAVLSSSVFTEILIKYGKYAVIIWLCGLITPGMILIYAIIIFKGISYGFTTAILVKRYSSMGVLFATASYLPQNIIIIPVYIILACVGVEFILGKYLKTSAKSNLRREKEKNIIEYVILLVGAIVMISVACIVEIYIVPFLMNILIGIGS